MVEEFPERVLAGADVFLLTETVLGRLSRLPPRTLISLLGAEAFRGDAMTAVVGLVGLVFVTLRERPCLFELTGVEGARIDLGPCAFEACGVVACNRLTGVVLLPPTLLLPPLGVSINGVRGFMVGDLRQRWERGDNARRRSRSRGGAFITSRLTRETSSSASLQVLLPHGSGRKGPLLAFRRLPEFASLPNQLFWDLLWC